MNFEEKGVRNKTSFHQPVRHAAVLLHLALEDHETNNEQNGPENSRGSAQLYDRGSFLWLRGRALKDQAKIFGFCVVFLFRVQMFLDDTLTQSV